MTAAKPKPRPRASAPAARQLFLLLKNGSILPLGEKRPTSAQMGEARLWCEEGGPWIAADSARPDPAVPVPWRCDHPTCLADARPPCPWIIDHLHRVYCGVRGVPHDKPILFRGGPADPPAVSKTSRSEALRPVRLWSGLLLENKP